MHRDQDGLRRIVDTYDSPSEMFEAALGNRVKVGHRPDKWAYPQGEIPTREGEWDYLQELALTGWEAGLQLALPISESAVRMVEQELPQPFFQAEWGLSGSEVDMGRFLSGVPECMIEFAPITVSKTGRVITLVVGSCYSAAYGVETILKRGASVVALATALQELQHETEIWIDCSFHGKPTEYATIRTLVKGTHDVVDGKQLAYWLAHPTVLRRLCFAVEHEFPPEWQRACDIGLSYGHGPYTVDRSLYADGAIIIDGFSSDHTNNPQKFVTKQLQEIGLLEK